MKATALQKRHAYLAMGGAGILFGAGYLGMSFELPYGRLDQPGAGVFPIVAGVILMVASLVTIWEGWQVDRTSRIDLPGDSDLNRLLGLIGLLFGFFVALPWLGQAFSSAIFCILLMRLLSDLSWPRIVIYSLVMCGGLYVMFVMLLKVPMPRGVLVN